MFSISLLIFLFNFLVMCFVFFFCYFFLLCFFFFFFFFSSRRRHTRSLRDWSSDVCSSDLDGGGAGLWPRQEVVRHHRGLRPRRRHVRRVGAGDRRRRVRSEVHEQIGRASCRERV